jgi:SAM-dependent methyltransferase
MDRLITTDQEQLRHPEAWARDRWVKTQAEKSPVGSWVLDAGAGASKYRPFFAHCRYETQDFCRYEGPLVKYAEPVTYVCDITAIPLPSGCLDAILCTEVIEHVADPMAVVTEFARLLKPGGTLWLTSPLLSHLHMEPYHYYGGFTHYWYRHWLPRRGFTIDSVTPVGGPGRTCVYYCEALYTEWSAAERGLSTWARLVSRAFRAPAKVLVHWALPRLFPRLDPWLGSKLICSGYMVVATRSQVATGSHPGDES